jgi:hypothetical protein
MRIVTIGKLPGPIMEIFQTPTNPCLDPLEFMYLRAMVVSTSARHVVILWSSYMTLQPGYELQILRYSAVPVPFFFNNPSPVCTSSMGTMDP